MRISGLCEKHYKYCIQIIILLKYNAPPFKCSLPNILRLHMALPRRVGRPMSILHWTFDPCSCSNYTV